jgi:transcriptional regulator with XRE-family HTH domain
MGYRGVPTIRKRIVGDHLKRMRHAAGMSLDDVSTALHISRSAADRRESGHTKVSLTDMQAYLRLFGVTDSEHRERMEVMARNCSRRGWWSRYSTSVGKEHVDLADAEDLAQVIYYMREIHIPALLETDAYSESILESCRESLEAQGISVERSLDLRMRRKKILDREDPPMIHALIGEAALLSQQGGAEVMSGQVQRLLELSEYPNITIRIFPLKAGAPVGSTVMLLGGDAKLRVTADAVGSFNDDSALADAALALFERGSEQALTEDASRQYLEKMTAEHAA